LQKWKAYEQLGNREKAIESYDGINYHTCLSWIPTDWLFIAGLMVEMKYPTVLVGYSYSFK